MVPRSAIHTCITSQRSFYAPDLKLGNNWYVVQSCTPRALYDVQVPVEEVHQEQEENLNLTVDLNMDQLSLTRGTVPLDTVDALTIALHDINQKTWTDGSTSRTRVRS